MNCVICRQADVEAGNTVLTLERGRSTLVVKNVPAHVCPSCGEAYVDEEVATRLLREAEEMVQAGTQVDFRQYVPA